MNRWIRCVSLTIAVGFPPWAQAQQAERQEREQERQAPDQEREARRQEEKQRHQEQYERGTEAVEREDWDTAIRVFQEVAEAGTRRTDAALYWKAYAQSKSGHRPEALATLQDLRKRFAESRWLRQAQALDLEIRQASGQAPNPESVGDEDLKLMALNSLMNMDAERALPLLEKLLAGSTSRKLRERALFVLCQSRSPRGREIVVKIARGQESPDLQRKAIEYLGLFGGPDSRQALADIYASAPDIGAKKAVLRSFMVAGEKARVLAAAKGEADPELRREAIQQLGVMNAQEELWALYQSESAPSVKRTVINALFIGGNADRLTELAKSEKDPQLRRDAINHLGLFGKERTGPLLVSFYNGEKDPQVKKAALQGLFVQGNAEALIEIARREKDPELRKDVVGQLSHMNSKAATEFLLEILNK
jgi:HEAT repeat protein